MSFTALFLASLFISNSGSQCITPTDEFAVEVVVPDYDVDNLVSSVDRYINLFYAPSQEDERIITLFQQTETPSGLSLRLQLPTDALTLTEPHYRIVSTSVETVKRPFIQYYLGWAVRCTEDGCSFTKGNKIITGSFREKEATLEINQALEPCSISCSGVCFTAARESLCINQTVVRDIEPLLRFTNISTNLSVFLESYRVVSVQGSSSITIVPAIDPDQNWPEALARELRYWNNQGVISLEDEDIQEITSLATLGQAGHNYRIVQHEGEWVYYNQLPDAVLVDERDCRIISLEEDAAVSEQPTNLFYIIPTILGTTALVLFIVLIAIARTLSHQQKKKDRAHPMGKDLKTDKRSEAN